MERDKGFNDTRGENGKSFIVFFRERSVCRGATKKIDALEGVPNGRRQIKQTQHMKQTKKEVKKRERAVPELFLEGFEGG